MISVSAARPFAKSTRRKRILGFDASRAFKEKPFGRADVRACCMRAARLCHCIGFHTGAIDSGAGGRPLQAEATTPSPLPPLQPRERRAHYAGATAIEWGKAPRRRRRQAGSWLGRSAALLPLACAAFAASSGHGFPPHGGTKRGCLLSEENIQRLRGSARCVRLCLGTPCAAVNFWSWDLNCLFAGSCPIAGPKEQSTAGN